MLDAVRYIAANPGCAIRPVARHVGPNGSLKYGYRTVHRCIQAGLIRAARLPSGVYCLEVAQ